MPTATTTTTKTNTKAALTHLSPLLQDRLITPALTPHYHTAVTTPWSQTCWTHAAGYIYPRTVAELAQALAILTQTDTKFALRATGHNPNAGFSSADESALVLDISRFREMEVTADGVARVGAGCTWGEVYGWLEARGLEAVGARQVQVGVAGFVLGGGMGALPNLYGTGADGVRNYEVLLADGRVVDANAHENPDLYRALKGGGTKFGIVTRFDLETHPLNPYDYTEINRATAAAQMAMEDDPKIGLFTNFNDGVVAVGMFYADHIAASSPSVSAFAPFHDLNPRKTGTALPTTTGTLLSLAEVMGHAQDLPGKRAISSVTTRVSHDLYDRVYQCWAQLRATLPVGCVLHYTIQPMGTAGVQAGRNRGGNIMGLEEVPQCWWVFTCEWSQDAGVDVDAAAHRAVRTMSEMVEALARKSGVFLDFKCMNFAGAGQKVLASYGAENVRQMRAVADEYDPEGVWQDLQFGGVPFA
ncbi:FAD-binding domain-containing protein [Aspergillus uvarum CBS 121591]|uniref:FAD-binding domain-containing protein n=1 Tax=Aspergillus uvarum CBS 121591 TaxID=1448315 RepID=A0A319CS13_9EURO|nr:FAD-binding domain-containing protein [Aspergillus uvarum CBS 121591]PYH81523.1 FAD-binding domain-containing protein [Aspergillus uvarum CBS 121591]